MRYIQSILTTTGIIVAMAACSSSKKATDIGNTSITPTTATEQKTTGKETKPAAPQPIEQSEIRYVK